MHDIKHNDKIELSLPASKDLMLVVRLATSGVVARAGLTLDVLDDVKMAVEEACLYLMTQDSKPSRLSLAFELKQGAIGVDISCADMTAQPGKTEQAELDVVRCILESLVGAVDIQLQGEAVQAIRLRAGALN